MGVQTDVSYLQKQLELGSSESRLERESMPRRASGDSGGQKCRSPPSRRQRRAATGETEEMKR